MTLDAMLRVYDQQIEVEVSKLNEALVERINQHTLLFTQNGMMGSSRATLQMGAIAADSLQERALMAIKVSSQCAVAGGVDLNAGNVEAVTSRIKEWLKEQAQFVKDKVDGSQSITSMNDQKRTAHDIVRQRLELMNKKVEADYAFMAMQAATASDVNANAASLSPVISVSGPVGVIQTGNQNTAHVSQRLDEGMIETLTDALMPMSEQLAHEGDHPDIKEAIDLAVAEMEKSEPNKTVLAGLMTSIIQTVEFIPKLQKFADTLRSIWEGTK
ncbi:hypothetical protein [Hoeflea sp.]|uniref:hypothetical protein n=1 Tax=Hoeflea sp. TaxID=1940281 RepID=UPI003B024BA2